MDSTKLLRSLAENRLFARRFLLLDKCESTSDFLRSRLGESEAPDFVICREQLLGRGRRSRDWWSGPANKNLSFTFRIKAPSNPLCGGLIAACAVAKTCEHFSNQRAALKWPNDVLLQNQDGEFAKVAGLLSEMPAESDELLIGIGINILATPPANVADYPSTCVAKASAAGIAVPKLEVFLSKFLWELEKRWRKHQNCGPTALESEYFEYLKVWAPNGVAAPEDSTMPRGRLIEFSVRDGLKWGDTNPEQHPLGLLPRLQKI